MRRRRAIAVLVGWLGAGLLPGSGCSPERDSDTSLVNPDGTLRESPEADEISRLETLDKIKKEGKLGKVPRKALKGVSKKSH